MTEDELAKLRTSTAAEYAAEQVRFGLSSAEHARAAAVARLDELLPVGLETPGMRLLTAELSDSTIIGHLWLELRRDAAQQPSAWLYSIEVVEHLRGKGYGKALLDAAEEDAAIHGATTLGLNVFGANHVARHLYEGSGYEITAQQMHKPL
jgi:ribosomal protein S18 acetylase RimI-like enzyme